MDEKWFFTLPDFNNSEDWIPDKPLDFASDENQSKVVLRKLGTASSELILGMVIRKRNRLNLSLIMDEYKTTDGKGPFILKWWVDGDEENYGIACKSADGGWHVRKPYETVIWILTCDPKKKRMKAFGVRFQEMRRGRLN